MFIFNETLKYPSRQQPAKVLTRLFATLCTCPCYDVHGAMDMAFMLWYLTRDAPPNNNYWPSMSHCSVSRLIILHISGFFHPFIFSQFENEAPRVWADPQKKQEILIFLNLQTFFLQRGFLALHFRWCFCLRVWWEHEARFCKSCCCTCWQNLMNLLDGTNSCQEGNLIGWQWHRTDTILNNECIAFLYRYFEQ